MRRFRYVPVLLAVILTGSPLAGTPAAAMNSLTQTFDLDGSSVLIGIDAEAGSMVTLTVGPDPDGCRFVAQLLQDQGTPPALGTHVAGFALGGTTQTIALPDSGMLIVAPGGSETIGGACSRGVPVTLFYQAPGANFIDRALKLNGTAAYAEAPNGPGLEGTSDWTLEAWFKDDDPNGFDHDFREILIKGDRDANGEAPYYVLVGRKSILAGVRTGGQDYPITWDLVFAGLDPRGWHHVAVTFVANLNVLNLWLDGQHIRYMQIPRHSTVGNALPVEIGRGGPATGKYWIGKLDDVRIWNVARKGADISHDFRFELSGAQPGLVANWHFDEGNFRLAADTSGNQHDASLSPNARFSTDGHEITTLLRAD